MSLFLVNKPPHDGRLKEDLIAPHPTLPLIATGWASPTCVLITDNEGEPLTSFSGPEGGAPASNEGLEVTSLAWHPVEKVLVVGWSSGKMTLWAMQSAAALGFDTQSGASDSAHESVAYYSLASKAALKTDVSGAVREHNSGAVVASQWSTKGEFLVTASTQHAVAVWVLERSTSEKSAASAGTGTVIFTIKPLWSVESDSIFRGIIHVPVVPPAGVTAAAAAALDDEVSFLLLDESKNTYFLNDEKNISVCTTHDDTLAAALYDPKLHLLATLTVGYMVDVFRLGEDHSATSVSRRKLLTAPSGSEKVKPCMAWCAPNVLAFGCSDNRLRVIDLNIDQLYNVSFPLADEKQVITSIAALQSENTVAVGSQQGIVALYDFRPPPTPEGTAEATALLSRAASRDPAKDWEAQTTHDLGEGINRIRINAMGDIVACTNQGTLQVLHESIRKRAWDGVAAATQISPEMVVIESVTGCQCLLKSAGKIKGLSITFPYIALWNGTKIDIYTINESTSASTLVNFVPSTSTAFAIHREGIFYVKEGRIVFCNFQLVVLTQVAFNENEGAPMLIDVMGDFVAFVSTKNYLRLARINARGLTPLGASRPLNLNEALPEAQRSDAQINVMAARVNAQGRRVALMTRQGQKSHPDTRVWVYDAETDRASCFDFATRNETLEAVYWNTPEPNANSIGDLEYLLLACETRQANTAPSLHPLDAPAPAADAAGADANKAAAPAPAGPSNPTHEYLPDMENFKERGAAEERRGSVGATNLVSSRAHNLVTLFATARDGLIVHNSVLLKSYQICLVGLTIPDFLLSSCKIHGDPSNPEDYVIEQKRLRDFEGLRTDKDVAVREALMRFSYYSTIGNMDEAYRCIKTIKDGAAWQALARMCVSNGRLDVAAVCLATMQDGVSARALREAREEYPNNKEVQLATLACSLGMVDEAEEILRSCKRYDLITDLYLACGKFEHAQRHSERFDRMRIHPVAYKYAEFMESLQNMDAAIIWYYNSKCADTDVPRVYFQTNRLPELRELIMPNRARAASGNGTPANSGGGGGGGGETAAAAAAGGAATTSPTDDTQTTFAALLPQNTDLLLWWARYSERRHNIQEALRFYHAGHANYDVVRILCSLNPPKIDNAIDIVNADIEKAKSKFDQQVAMAAGAADNAPKDPDPVGAAFFIGKYYEAKKDYPNAIKYYKHAAAFRSGVRVSRAAGQESSMLSFALASEDVHLMLDCAAYFERKGSYDRAVELYRKVGATQMALDMCVKGGLYDTLHDISTGLVNASADPEVFMNMSAHFQSTGHYQKAVEMLVFAKHYDEAIAMCQERNVTLTEEMSESMTGDGNTTQSKDEKRVLNERIAQIATEQGSWNLACKKYTQLGERVKAMKMLMRGGDVEKVIFYANHSRNNEIYTLAANFLQSQNWSSDPQVFKSIVQFYTKAKAYDSLAKFYDSGSQVQIDEHRNYIAALRILVECVQTLEKANTAKGNVNMSMVERFKQRATIIRDFIKAQQLVDGIPNGQGAAEGSKEKADQVVAICSDFVKRSRPNSPDAAVIEEAIRIGDVFGLLARFYFDKMNEPRNAIKVIESMQKQGAEPQYYMEMELIGKICRANERKVQDVITIIDSSNAAEARSRRRSNPAS